MVIEKDMVKLSVIIPVYNACDFIEECVDGVIRVTIPDMEIILVDDGSTDGSFDVCTELREKDSRIRTYQKANGGSASARNYGLERARGEYVSFIDSDDTIDSKGYESVFLSAYRDQTDISCFAMTSEAHGTVAVPDGYKGSVWELFIKKPIYMHSVCNKFFKKKIIDGIRFDEDLVVCEDMLFCAKVFLKANSITYCDVPIYKYRVEANSITHATKAIKQARDDIEAADRLMCYVGDGPEKEEIRRLIAFRHQIAGLRYLTEPDLFSVEEYKKTIVCKDAYKDLPIMKHRALCCCANYGIMIIPIMYIIVKSIIKR